MNVTRFPTSLFFGGLAATSLAAAGCVGGGYDSPPVVYPSVTQAQYAEMAALPALAEGYHVPRLASDIATLQVAVSARLSGGTMSGETPEAASATCLGMLKQATAQLGFSVVSDASQPHDMDVEMACGAYMKLQTLGNVHVLERPPVRGPAAVYRVNGQPIDEMAAPPPRMRCDTAAPDENAMLLDCSARYQEYVLAAVVQHANDSAALHNLASRVRSAR